MVGMTLTRHVTSLVRDTTTETYAAARTATEGARSLRDVIEDTGILDRLGTDEERAEAVAVLDALPRALDEALLAAGRSAFARELPIRARWVEGDTWAVRVVEERGWLRVTIESPDGMEFV